MLRTQIYLDDEQTARLDKRASTEGATRSKLIRLAIDEFLSRDDHASAEWKERWRQAIRETVGIAPYLGDEADATALLPAGDAARLSDLDACLSFSTPPSLSAACEPMN